MTVDIVSLVSDNLDIWATAIERKSGSGRGGGKRVSLYGIDRLRALVLDIAVRGKLVRQDTSDEPARELLKQFKMQRAQWISEKRIRNGKPLEKIVEKDCRFATPTGWQWTRFGHLGDWGAGATPNRKTSSYYGGETPWFKSGELVGDYISRSEEMVTDHALKECSLRLNAPGDVLIAMYGATIGKASILEIEATTNQAVCACTPFDGVFNRFLLLLLKAMRPIFVGQGAGGAQPNISREKIIATALCLPPLAEQQRIVAKVDELMALCDALETESAVAITAHQTLVEDLLATLTTSSNAADLATNWARLEAHFDILFTTEASIDALKQNILDIAVHGKLVAQDKNDERASALLRRIQNERAKIIGAKKASEVPTEIDSAVILSDGWEWTPLASLGFTMTGGTPKSAEPENFKGSIPFIGPGQISPAGEILTAEKFISETGLVQSTEALPGDVLMVCIGGSIGKSAISRARTAFNQQINSLRPVLVEGRYVEMYLKCSRFQTEVLDRATGSATPIINRSRWESIPVALPPLTEQQRIVAKVDELLAMCDQLLADLADAALTQKHLAETIVELAAA